MVTALFLQETLASAANDADIQLENSRRLAADYQKKLEDKDGHGPNFSALERQRGKLNKKITYR